VTLAALLSCHNRREKTITCLDALFAQELPAGCRLEVFLTDDGSTDGTAAAVRERFPAVRLLAGDGTLFWNGGMRLAFGEALKGDHDFYLWLNDDTLLDSGALAALLRTHEAVRAAAGAEVIVTGTTRSPDDGRPTYGGVERRSRLRRTRFSLVVPGDIPVECETMNGNCVLVPRQVAERVGNLDGAFVHGMGDFDYGLRARAAGFSVWVMPGFVGFCGKNPLLGTFYDGSLPVRERWRRMHSPKGLPPGEWKVFCRRHAGPFWPIFFLWPYVRVLFRQTNRP
jgi:GT2 family glycosyltransferase